MGDIDVLDNAPRGVSCITQDDGARLVRVKQATLMEFIRAHPHTLETYVQQAVARLWRVAHFVLVDFLGLPGVRRRETPCRSRSRLSELPRHSSGGVEGNGSSGVSNGSSGGNGRAPPASLLLRHLPHIVACCPRVEVPDDGAIHREGEQADDFLLVLKERADRTRCRGRKGTARAGSARACARAHRRERVPDEVRAAGDPEGVARRREGRRGGRGRRHGCGRRRNTTREPQGASCVVVEQPSGVRGLLHRRSGTRGAEGTFVRGVHRDGARGVVFLVPAPAPVHIAGSEPGLAQRRRGRVPSGRGGNEHVRPHLRTHSSAAEQGEEPAIGAANDVPRTTTTTTRSRPGFGRGGFTHEERDRGETIGEALLAGGRYPSTAMCLRDSELVRMSRGALTLVCARTPSPRRVFSRRWLASFTRR